MNKELALFKYLGMPSAYAATGTTVVSYNNAAAVGFTINIAALAPGAYTGSTLSYGSISLATLSDNSLKVCGVGGTTKCNTAIIRMYTTGSVAGFVNTDESYGVPLYAGSLNPSSPLGLNSAGSVQVQTYTIPGSTHKLTMANFPSPQYNMSVDMSNAGSGQYDTNLVVEYALSL